jgi:hypothetical protein
MRIRPALVLLVLAAAGWCQPLHAARDGRGGGSSGGWFQIGVGAHYWHTLEQIQSESSLSRDGIAWALSTRILPQYWIHLAAEVEQFPDEFVAGSGKDAETYAPAGYLVVGKGLYGAVGIGGYYTDGTFGNEPFYALRAGLMTVVLPSLWIDVHANYRFANANVDDLDQELKKVNADTITLGAALRIEF